MFCPSWIKELIKHFTRFNSWTIGMAVLVEPLVNLTPDTNLDVGENEGDTDNRGTMVVDSTH